jgi:hypothetical protein
VKDQSPTTAPSVEVPEQSQATPSSTVPGQSQATPSSTVPGQSQATPSSTVPGQSHATTSSTVHGPTACLPLSVRHRGVVDGWIRDRFRDHRYNNHLPFTFVCPYQEP